MKRRLCKIGIVIIAVIALFLFGVRLYFRIPERDYYRAADKSFVIPEGNYGFVSQGISFDEESGLLFLTGYKNNHMASPVYLIDVRGDKKDRQSDRIVYLKSENGADFLGHCGGISVHGDYVYIAGAGLSDHCLYVFDKREILDHAGELGRAGIATCIGTVPLHVSDEDYLIPAFTTIKDNVLYVGEFYRKENYPTCPSHTMTTPAGDTNHALILAYEFSHEAGSLFGLKPEPLRAYSVTDKIQGMCIDGDGTFFLSSSYGLDRSHIYAYTEKGTASHTLSVLGSTVPLTYLDSEALIKDTLIPPMSEELEIVDGSLLVNCESASNQYIFGKFTGGKWVYALPPQFFK